MRFKPAAMVLLAAIMVFTGTASAFALQFTDIHEAPWAQTHIERMAAKGVVSGSLHPATGRRVYLPNNPVTRVESVVMLYSLLQKTDQLTSQTDYTAKYQLMLSSARIPDWARKQVGYALENGIITTGDLSGFMRDSRPEPIQNPASREEVAVYFGRALDSAGAAAVSTISLAFLDTEMISSVAMPYINLLVQKRILSGDDQNRFNPRSTITRAEMAALASKTYDALVSDQQVVIDLTPTLPQKDDQAVQAATIREGAIQRVNQDTGVIFVLYEEDLLEMHQVTSSTLIRINSLPHELINLRQGQKAEFTFGENNQLLRIEIDPRRTYYQGTVVQMVNLVDFYAITLESSTSASERRSFQVYPDALILIDGAARNLTALRAGDHVRVEFQGQRALTIEKGNFDNRVQLIDGILDSTVNFTRAVYTVQVMLPGGQVREYELDEEVVVRIGNSRGYLEDLTRGDIVILEVSPEKNNRVTRIEAAGLERARKVRGTIDSMTIARNVQISFTDQNRLQHTYIVGEGARVYVDNNRVELRDLRLPSEATLHLEGGTVTEIDASRSFGSQVMQGRILRIRDSLNMFVLRHLNTSGSFQETAVYITDKTVIHDRSGGIIRLRNLSTNQEIFVTGVAEGNEFIADRILVIQD